ncbi:hypothetical protein FJV41_33010 [Myxococcus llanfairpwllgwyngyllgogerychwyrndrobwllllantysiliogogogochensis]|uniref:Uncharacterized protein n=1 Tax=Myxococcus llanfairpwllgwyngyllgogerychwyrndrobwllllantysiliogogogochensis TaxID=2590453 RepID=A0A540WRS0_9BACT|nr:hypothetical protein [Myxococcus llanfairpwllgwyngyllgogerychwyrndrobwllllantysiliogogogochensis]TQF11689.1 hypothetical protein FJV41_33010 [Myxococcus llanfairpwllgwyngyllgogerychwyrndrobwllllantysiliogogogochensis]
MKHMDGKDFTMHWWEASGHICFYNARGEVSRLLIRQLQEEAVKVVCQHPSGIRLMPLAREVHNQHPEAPFASIPPVLRSLGRITFTNVISRPERGLFVPIRMGALQAAGPAVREEEFHLPLAEFIEGDVEELTAAVPMGSQSLSGPWRLPDIVGVYRRCAGDSFSWTPEVLAVEVRGTTEDILTAYGQAAAHQLFAAKTYLALPHTLSFSDRRELVARCQLHGLGLILFGPSPRDEYTALVPARRCPPAPDEAQRFSERLRAHDEEKFRILFG